MVKMFILSLLLLGTISCGKDDGANLIMPPGQEPVKPATQISFEEFEAEALQYEQTYNLVSVGMSVDIETNYSGSDGNYKFLENQKIIQINDNEFTTIVTPSNGPSYNTTDNVARLRETLDEIQSLSDLVISKGNHGGITYYFVEYNTDLLGDDGTTIIGTGHVIMIIDPSKNWFYNPFITKLVGTIDGKEFTVQISRVPKTN